MTKGFDREEYPLQKLRELPDGARQRFNRGELALELPAE
jgi:hypothetical protein